MQYRPVGLQLLTTGEELAALAPEWEQLAGRCPGYHLSQTHPWAETAWRVVAQPAGRTLHCLALRDDDGRLVAVWPMVARRDGGTTVVRPLGFEGSEYSQPLVEPGDRRAARIEQLLQAAGRLGDAIELIHVPAGSALADVLAKRRQVAVAHDVLSASFIARADHADWKAFTATFSSKFRYALRRAAKRLAESGPVEIGPVAAADVPALVDWSLARKKAWLDQAGLRNDWIGRRSYRDFLVAMLGRDDPVGRMLLFAIRVAGQPVAANLVTVDRTRAEGYFTVFDPEWSIASPGSVLTEHVLAWTFERGLDLDFRIGDEAYKDRWTTRPAQVATWRIATGLRGVPEVLRLRYGQLRFAAGRCWRQWRGRNDAPARPG
jgi:CelD/BcsL family acetyltransferase involved in cellulose biosynthesis